MNFKINAVPIYIYLEYIYIYIYKKNQILIGKNKCSLNVLEIPENQGEMGINGDNNRILLV